jgi:thymidylate synthase (FAD)
LNVKLISHSQAPEYNESALDLVAYCARVSNPDNQNNKETATGLVKYLMKHKHWSPLEMVSCCLEIETTRDIARQILRHRSFSFQEFSQRYADPTKDLDFEVREARLQDPKNRQNSIKLNMSDEYEGGLQDRWYEVQQRVIDEATMAYNWAIDNGIAKEQARAVLPEGNTVSRMYVNGTLRSWVHYIELRGANGTQQEHIDIAHAVAKVIAEIFPISLQNESV